MCYEIWAVHRNERLTLQLYRTTCAVLTSGNRREECQIVANLVGVRLTDAGSLKDGRKACLLEIVLVKGVERRICSQSRHSKTYSTGREFIEQVWSVERVRSADKLSCQSSNEGYDQWILHGC